MIGNSSCKGYHIGNTKIFCQSNKFLFTRTVTDNYKAELVLFFNSFCPVIKQYVNTFFFTNPSAEADKHLIIFDAVFIPEGFFAFFCDVRRVEFIKLNGVRNNRYVGVNFTFFFDVFITLFRRTRDGICTFGKKSYIFV